MKSIIHLSTALALFVLFAFQSGQLLAQTNTASFVIPGGWVKASNWLQPFQESFGAGVSPGWIGSQMAQGTILLTHPATKALMLVQEGFFEDQLSLPEYVESPIIGGAGTYLTPNAEATSEQGGYSVSLTGTVAGRFVYAERRAVISTDDNYLLSVLVISPSQERISLETIQSSSVLIASAEFSLQENNLAQK